MINPRFRKGVGDWIDGERYRPDCSGLWRWDGCFMDTRWILVEISRPDGCSNINIYWVCLEWTNSEPWEFGQMLKF